MARSTPCGICPRCSASTSSYKAALCRPCARIRDEVIRRWAEGERLEENKEFAASLGMTTAALDKQISRLGLGRGRSEIGISFRPSRRKRR